MADTIKIGGTNVPKPVAIGGAIAAGVIGIYFYRNKKQKQDAAASVAAAGSTEIDPATGYPYGSPEDAAALASQNNYAMPGGYGFTGYAGGSGSSPFGTGAPGNFNSNAEWAQYVENYEVTNLGGDAPTVGNAIGKYLTGQVLTSDQQGLVQSAIAIAGYPPVSGPNGNPPGFATANPGNTQPPPPTPADTTNQVGTVHSTTTGETGRVNTNNGGKTWNYIGVKPKSNEPRNQTGTVHSDTTGKSAKVKTSDQGLHWTLAS